MTSLRIPVVSCSKVTRVIHEFYHELDALDGVMSENPFYCLLYCLHPCSLTCLPLLLHMRCVCLS